MNSVSWTSKFLILFFLCALSALNAAGDSKTTKLGRLEVTMFLRKGNTPQKEVPWPSEEVVLESAVVEVDGRTIQELLKANHIFPDVEAFTVVYEVNPDVKSLNDLQVSKIVVPVVRGGAKLQSMFDDGYIVLLRVDVKEKADFSKNVERLRGLVGNPLALPKTRFADENASARANATLKQATDSLVRISERIAQHYGRAIPTDVVSQLSGEARHLGDVISSDRQISQTELALIEGVGKDVEIKSRPFVETAAGEAPDRWPEVSVKVTTLKARVEVSGLRVVYVPEALVKYSDEFRHFKSLSSPTRETLPEADYCFWVIRDSDQQQRAVSSKQCLPIRAGQDNDIQLTVN